MFEERGRFIDHLGKRIYVVDLDGMTIEQAIESLPKFARDIRAEPAASVRTLTSMKDVTIERRLSASLKEFMIGNRPHVKVAAIVGLTPLQRVVVKMGQVTTKREFALFDTFEEAKDYLASIP